MAYAVAYTGPQRDSAAVCSVAKVRSEAETSKAASFKAAALGHYATPPKRDHIEMQQRPIRRPPGFAGQSHTAIRSSLTLGEGAELVSRLGFVVVDGGVPGPAGEAWLVVALRDRPTLRHFDPELVTYWQTGSDGRGHRAELARGASPRSESFSWGKIEVIDRLAVKNRFISLGGELTVNEVAADTTLAVFHSPGPILRLGGHSQDYDAVSVELGAFFGRMLVPIDFAPGVEGAVSAATPLERYCAFVEYQVGRLERAARLSSEPDPDARVLRAEATRLHTENPDAWEAGRRLLASLALPG